MSDMEQQLLAQGITEDQIDTFISKIEPNFQGGPCPSARDFGVPGRGVVVAGPLKKRLAALKPKERKFVVYYAESGNASDAARRAGWSSKSGNQVGHLLLQRDDIRACLKLAVESAGADSASRMLRAVDLAREMHGRVLDRTLPLAERTHAARVWHDAESVLNELNKFSMKVEVNSSQSQFGHFTAADAAVLVAANRLKFTGALECGTKSAQESSSGVATE